MSVVVDYVTFRSMAVIVAGILQTLVFILSEAAPPTTARRLIDSSGFISIDCGLATKSYYHEGSNLIYTSDENYITTGKRVAITSSNRSDSDVRFTTVRAFPDGNRNCYTLSPVQPNSKYLIRAWFLYDNYDGARSVPGFDLHVGVDFWVTVTIQSAGVRFGSEIIYVSTLDSVDVCLVNTGHGTPFISALELRPLGNAGYAATSDVSLRLFNRWDAGPAAEDRDDRLTDDVYDRVWFYSRRPFWELISTNKSIQASSDSGYKVPTGVLATAGQQINGAANFSVTYQLNDPTAKLYVYWHFAELQLVGPNQTREFDIFIPHGSGYKFGPVHPTYLTLNTIESAEIHLNGSKTFSYVLKRTNNSTLLPIINAAEIYVVLERRLSPTNRLDVDAVASIKKKYNITRNWQGDPCLPISYKWDSLVCAYNDSNPPRITALNLASSNLTGELPSSLSNLTLLYTLNLSNNGFSGKIPEFLAHLPALKFIDLTRNNLSGPVPAQLAEKARNKSIVLRLAGNPDICKSFPCEKDVTTKQKRHGFIIPLVASIALTLLIVISGLVLVAYRNRDKQVDQAIKSRNKQFSYSEIVKITNNFKKILGKGAFGSVYYGLLQDGTQVAVKILNNNTCPITIKQFCAECKRKNNQAILFDIDFYIWQSNRITLFLNSQAELLMKIHHINLVSLVGYCDERSKMALVCEYMSNVKNELPLCWKTRLDILIDTAQGNKLAYPYIHNTTISLIQTNRLFHRIGVFTQWMSTTNHSQRCEASQHSIG
ncbi:LOW QUALITY PROTEIN: hypothetical protein V2J09_022321 [Rumex salicifolius]